MKYNRLIFVFGTALLLVGVALALFATTIALPPPVSRVAGAYSGYADIEFLRLELDPDGSGLLSVSYIPGNPPRLYRIDSWKISGWTLDLQTTPIDTNAETITFRKVRFSWQSLDGELHGSNWEQDFKIYSEREWQSRSVPAQERITRYRKEGR